MNAVQHVEPTGDEEFPGTSATFKAGTHRTQS